MLIQNVTSFANINSFICTQLIGFKYSKLLNSSIWPIDGTLTGTNTPSLSVPGNNGNEEVLHILQSSRNEDLPSDSLVSYLGQSSVKKFYPSAEMQSSNSIAPTDWAMKK